jgi:hypothetical protein
MVHNREKRPHYGLSKCVRYPVAPNGKEQAAHSTVLWKCVVTARDDGKEMRIVILMYMVLEYAVALLAICLSRRNNPRICNIRYQQRHRRRRVLVCFYTNTPTSCTEQIIFEASGSDCTVFQETRERHSSSRVGEREVVARTSINELNAAVHTALCLDSDAAAAPTTVVIWLLLAMLLLLLLFTKTKASLLLRCELPETLAASCDCGDCEW